MKRIFLLLLATIVFTAVASLFPQNSREMVLSAATESAASIRNGFAVFTAQRAIQPETVSVATIFNDNKDWLSQLPADRVRTLIATGDVIPARSVNYQTTIKNNFLWPYENTAALLQQADITFVNLEAPLLQQCPLTHQGMIFCGNANHIQGLLYAGVDIVNLANNHSGNYGTAGVKETKELLRNNDIAVTGVQGPIYKNIRGVIFAILGYNDIGGRQPGISYADESIIVQEISQAKQIADVVIVAMHWGAEYRSQPDTRQQYLARLVIDAGADVIIGNHPHWIQPVEMYKGKLITYAHGNFIFDQEWSLKTKQGVVGKYTFLDSTLIDVEFFPIQIEDYGQPGLLYGENKKNILKAMEQESRNLKQ